MELLNVTGVLESGDVYTDQYVVTDDWLAGTPVYTGANGQLTMDNTSGAVVGIVVGVPYAGGNAQSMLGVRVKAA